jgi:two-component system cell cycle response regulator DivK
MTAPKKSVAPPSGHVSAGSDTSEAPLILIVDDFEDNRAMYVEYLQFKGFRVVEAVNGQEAVEKTTKLLPAVVVMDLSLPVMDGWEATRRLKANPMTKHIVVIALTGHAEAAHAKKALEAGCDDFVAKPCLPEELLDKVREHVGAKGAKKKADAKGKK